MIALSPAAGSLHGVAVDDSWPVRTVRRAAGGGTMRGVRAVVTFSLLTALAACGGSGGRFAAGDADEAEHIPVRPDTIFRLASVSKQFTAMIVLKLRDQGLLKLGDTICPYLVPKYVKACPKAWRPITIQEILVHTSGIPD